MGASILLAGQSMMLGLALSVSPPEPETKLALQVIVLLATLLVVALLGWPLATASWESIRAKRLSLELLFVCGLTAAMAASTQSMISGSGPIYFEVVSALLIIHSAGRWLGARGRADAARVIEEFATPFQRCLTIRPDGGIEEIEVTQIQVGSRVLSRPGDRISVDGIILQGEGFVQDAPIRGSILPRVYSPGDRILAGCLAIDASFTIEATCPGSSRQLDRLIEGAADCQIPSRLQAQADRLAQWLLPCVFFAAMITMAWWTAIEGWQDGLYKALAVLLVACPCGLGLAAPLLLSSARARLAWHGLWLRDAATVARLAEVDVVLLDKTGTLTESASEIVGFACLWTDRDREELISAIVAVQRRCNHPISTAFLRYFVAESDPIDVTGVRLLPGVGLEARVQLGGGVRLLRIGRGEGTAYLRKQLGTLTGTRIQVDLDGVPVALAVIGERVRPGLNEAVAALAAIGLPAQILTGDSEARMEVSPIQVGLLPAQKAERVKGLIQDGHQPLFVGDGINDAPALAAAHVGLAIGSGAELSQAVAAGLIYASSLRVLPWAIALSRQTVTRLRQVLGWTIAYNCIGILLAACGLLHPIIAALLMVGSSLLVVWSSSRIGCCGVTADESDRLGVRTRPSGHPWVRSSLHCIAVILQGFIVGSIVGDGRLAIPLTLLGLLLVAVWSWVPGMPHVCDMVLCMLTIGNFGMMAGMWLGGGEQGIACACGCPKLYGDGWHLAPIVGMLLGSIAAAFTTKEVFQWNRCLGGYVGMVLGMVGASLLHGQLSAASSGELLGQHYLLMSAGMIIGMLAGDTVSSELAASRDDVE